MYQTPQKECTHCKETKYIFEFVRKGSGVSSKCQECLKSLRKPSELEKLSKRAPPGGAWWKKPRWKSKLANLAT